MSEARPTRWIELHLAIVDGLGHPRQDATLFFHVKIADRRAELILLLPSPPAGLKAKIHKGVGFSDGLHCRHRLPGPESNSPFVACPGRDPVPAL